MLKIFDEPESPNEGECLRYGYILIYIYIYIYMCDDDHQHHHDVQEAPQEGACLRYIIDRSRQMRGRASDM